MMKKLGAAVTIAMVIIIALMGLRFTRGNSVNLRDLDESKKDFQKRMELVKRKLIVTQSEISSTVDADTLGKSSKRRPSITLSSASGDNRRGNPNDGYTSGTKRPAHLLVMER